MNVTALMTNYQRKIGFLGFLAVASAAIFNLVGVEAKANSAPSARGKYDRTEPFTVDYRLGRTYQTSYKNDPGTVSRLGMPVEQKCTPTKAFDFETGGIGPALSQQYFSDSRFADFQVIVLVSIPLQKMFVLDRRRYISSGTGNGLVYAWRTSTGYHDKHYIYSRKDERTVFGQKGVVQIQHQNRESALSKLRALAKKKGAKLNEENGRFFVTFSDSPTKRVEYSQGTTKIRKDRAQEQSLEIISDDPNSDRFVIVRRYALNYTDYFHTQPGHYVVQNGFSSRHLSGESDGAVSTEEPYMPWAVFFNRQRGMATHAAAYRGTLGSTGSHGCVRLLEENACRLFHLVGQTDQAAFSALNEKTGERDLGRTISGHRAIYVVTDTLGPVENRYRSPLLQ